MGDIDRDLRRDGSRLEALTLTLPSPYVTPTVTLTLILTLIPTLIGPGWKHGVNTTSSASDACNENWCGIEVLFRASVPSHLSHHAESLSASAFCSGVASAKEAIAQGSSIACNETDVMITTVHAHEEGENLIGVWIALGVVGVLVCCFCSCACGEGGGPLGG